jgi:hypothetical protein
MQRGAERAGLVGLAHSLFHLTQDLGFAQHHRVQPCGDAKRVSSRGTVFGRVRIGAELGRADPALRSQPLGGRLHQVAHVVRIDR